MDESAPITWLIEKCHSLMEKGASTYATTLIGYISPLVASCFSIYLLFVLLNYWRGTETNPVSDYLVRCISMALIIGYGLNADTYTGVVMPVVTGVGSDLASLISGGTVNTNTLDTLVIYYLDAIDKGFTAASDIGGLEGISTTVMVTLKAAIILCGLVPFAAVATALIITADAGSMFIAMVGPIFFAFLLFPATRAWFSAWLNAALSHALIPVMISAVCVWSVGISKEIFGTSDTLADAPMKLVILAAFANGVLLLLLRKLSMIASSLSAGGINIGSGGPGVGGAARAGRDSVKQNAREARAIRRAMEGNRNAGGRAQRNSIKKAG